MALSERQLLDALSRMPFIDAAELADVPGEAHATVHRALTSLLTGGIAGRVSHGTAHLPSSKRYYLTAHGHRRGRRDARFRHALGLGARLPGVPGVAGAADPPDGRSGFRLPPRFNTLPRDRRAPVPGGVPPPGPLRHHHHPPRRAQFRRGASGLGSAAAVPLTTGCGPSPGTATGAAPAPC